MRGGKTKDLVKKINGGQKMITKIKITDRSIVKKNVEYTATVTIDKEKEEKVTGNFPAHYLTNDVELKMIDNVIYLHIQYPNLFKDFIDGMKFQDFSKLKRKAKDRENTFLFNKDFKAWLKVVLENANSFHGKLPKDVNPLKPITKVSEKGITQPMDCYFYLAGINKAHTHYFQIDFNFKKSKYPKEIMKENDVMTWFKGTDKVEPKTEVKAKDLSKNKPIAKNTATKTEVKKAQGQPKGKKQAVAVASK